MAEPSRSAGTLLRSQRLATRRCDCPWVDDLFFGLALILAVGFSTYRRKVYGGERRWWRQEENETGMIFGMRLPLAGENPIPEELEEWWYDPDDKQGHHTKPE